MDLVLKAEVALDEALVLIDPLFAPHVPAPYLLLAEFVFGFFVARCLGWLIVKHLLGFDPRKYSAASAASSVVCFLHGIPVTACAGWLLLDAGDKIWELDAGIEGFSEHWQKLATKTLTFSSAYMVYDFVFMIVNGCVYGTKEEPYGYEPTQYY